VRSVALIPCIAFVLMCLLPAASARADSLTVFAAASLKTALDAAARDYRSETGTDIAVSYAGTSTLARQIEHGAPADVAILANVEWMDFLATEGRIKTESRRDLLGNRLVVIGPADAPPLATLADLPARLGEGWLAMALVDAVPAGIYGKAALDALDQWESIRHSVAQADNVRAALALVATGAAALGIVYATDAHAEPRVRVLAEIDPGLHMPIVYPAAAVAGGETALASDFLRFLASEDGRRHFVAQGFVHLGRD